MKTIKTSQYPENPAIGCYFDGCYGFFETSKEVIELALAYGWQDADAIKLAEGQEYNVDEQTDIVDDAADYLNSLETRPFVSWQWYDGDFGLYPDVESARENCEFVSSQEQDEPVASFRGEWLHVNDHGNVTLYVRDEQGNDTEIWSAV